MTATGAPTAPARRNALDPYADRADFPALHQEVHGRTLVYLDTFSFQAPARK